MTRTAPLPLRLLLVLALVLGVTAALPTPADASSSAEQDFVNRINQERSARGLPRLSVASDLRSVARSHSQTMSAQQRLHHNPSLGSDVSNWQRLAENVGVGPSSGQPVTRLHNALMDSDGHRANILDARVSEVGVGVVVANGRMWVTQVFRLPRGAAVLSSTSSSPSTKTSSPQPKINPFPGGFSDVDRGSTHGPAIERLRKAKVAQGCGNNRYCPTKGVTRAQMASLVARTMKLDVPSGNRFRDVSGPHTGAINALADAGITKGCNPPRNDRFCPDDTLTRAQMASLIARAKKLPLEGDAPFADVTGTHSKEIGALAKAGITKGCDAKRNRFCPRERVTRAQVASFLDRGFDF